MNRERTLKFALLNVQGLTFKRFDKLQSEEFKSIIEGHDVIMLTETWINVLSRVDIHVDGYEHFILNRTIKHPNAKRDSCGLIVKNYLVCRDTLIKMVEDRITCSWFKFNGNLFNLEDDIYMCLCYNTPIGSSREIFNDKNIFLYDFR